MDTRLKNEKNKTSLTKEEADEKPDGDKGRGVSFPPSLAACSEISYLFEFMARNPLETFFPHRPNFERSTVSPTQFNLIKLKKE